MSKFKFQINFQIKNAKSFGIGIFVIPLTFACLPCTRTVQGLREVSLLRDEGRDSDI